MVTHCFECDFCSFSLANQMENTFLSRGLVRASSSHQGAPTTLALLLLERSLISWVAASHPRLPWEGATCSFVHQTQVTWSQHSCADFNFFPSTNEDLCLDTKECGFLSVHPALCVRVYYYATAFTLYHFLEVDGKWKNAKAGAGTVVFLILVQLSQRSKLLARIRLASRAPTLL